MDNLTCSPDPQFSWEALTMFPTSRYRSGLRLGDLAGLSLSLRNGGEDAVQAYYGWRNARTLAIAKGSALSGVSLLSAWLIPFLKGEYHGTPSWLVLGLPGVLMVGMFLTSIYVLLRLDRVHDSFISAMIWLRRL